MKKPEIMVRTLFILEERCMASGRKRKIFLWRI